jgi:hypothetical protein
LERKSMPIVAWYMLSNESYMKRVMSDVLPTVAHVCLANMALGCRLPGAGPHTALFPEKDEPAPEVSNMSSRKALLDCPYLNFFSGLLYDPPAPACAMVVVVVVVD